MAQAITSQPPRVKRPVANDAAAPTLQASEPAVSWLGVTRRRRQSFSSGSKHHYPNSMKNRLRKTLPGSFFTRSGT